MLFRTFLKISKGKELEIDRYIGSKFVSPKSVHDWKEKERKLLATDMKIDKKKVIVL